MKMITSAVLLMLVMAACEKDEKYTDPYAGGKDPLGVQLSTEIPAPSEAGPGTTIKFRGKGLLKHKDVLKFNFNSEPGEIVNVDSAGIQVKVPVTASTGVTSVTIGDQIFFGPLFRVRGNLDIDNNYKVVVGANNWVNDVHRFADGRLLLVGDFLDYERKGIVRPISRIVLTSRDGEMDRTLQSGRGADGSLNSIAALPNGKLVVAGSFASYDIHQAEIHNITVLNSNGSLDSVNVKTFTDRDTVPSFNGGTDGHISKVFVHNNRITAIGRFNYYLQFVYGKSDYRQERDSLITDSILVRQLIRFHPDGSLDSSFNYDLTRHRSFDGPNGPVTDAYQQADGKIIIVGRFTRYNGLPAPYIARINNDGTLDAGFGGSGADNTIGSIRFNEVTRRFVLAGQFKKFDSSPADGLVLLREDGTPDEQFRALGKASNESYWAAQQLSNGMIVVNGGFTRYDGVHRSGFMILDSKGKLAPGYNNTGDFSGTLVQLLETTNSSGQIQALIMGRFNRFNEKEIGNVVRLLFK
ncbi:DUF5008 domain-containing protein [Chitinophaga rhizophila]|uniref:DUF5008 domain-containing protein n=1 Tax=Chitinophaga rhizophila TaxID=2866212 RepID=A0ABS7G9P1_9BACT|nr:DUF5008 domain-containing protein [Chitinophaga rhizophila]MBW8684156.1 DUF5008 domain-containing protein [Chitinophaga rhizophila]